MKKATPNAQRSTPNSQRSTSNFGVQRSAFDVSPTPNSSFLTPNSSARSRAEGFTLFELLAVITIIGIVLAVTLGSFTGWGDAHAVRGSADVVEAALAQARDYAVSRRVPVSFTYVTSSGPTNGIKQTTVFQLATFSDGQPIGVELQHLPGSVWLTPKPELDSPLTDYYGQYVFFPNGTVSNAISVFNADQWHLYTVSRKMRDAANQTPAIIFSITIDPATGTATAERYEH